MLLNKITLFVLLVVGIAVGNYWICLSVVPALIVNVIVYVLIASHENYNELIRKQMLRRSVEVLNENIYMQILMGVAKLSVVASILYLAFQLYTKFFGVIQL